MRGQTSGRNTLILRLEIDLDIPFIRIANAVHETGGEIIAVDMISKNKNKVFTRPIYAGKAFQKKKVVNNKIFEVVPMLTEEFKKLLISAAV